MPTTLPKGLVLAAIGEREAPEDVLLVNPKHKGCGGLAGLPAGSVVGTSSLRRAAVVHQEHPSLVVEVIRGNLNTRLAKLDGAFDWSTSKAPQIVYDAVILARAGVLRLGWEDRIESVLGAEEMPYGVSQGSLGIECREDDELALRLCGAVNHVPSLARCLCERALLRGLQGGCQIALGVRSEFTNVEAGSMTENATSASTLARWKQCGSLSLSATLMRDGKAPANAAQGLGHLRLLAEASGTVRCVADAEEIGSRVALDLLAQGGHMLVDTVKTSSGTGEAAAAAAGAAGAAAAAAAAPQPTTARPLSYGSAEMPNKDAAAAIGGKGR